MLREVLFTLFPFYSVDDCHYRNNFVRTEKLCLHSLMKKATAFINCGAVAHWGSSHLRSGLSVTLSSSLSAGVFVAPNPFLTLARALAAKLFLRTVTCLHIRTDSHHLNSSFLFPFPWFPLLLFLVAESCTSVKTLRQRYAFPSLADFLFAFPAVVHPFSSGYLYNRLPCLQLQLYSFTN